MYIYVCVCVCVCVRARVYQFVRVLYLHTCLAQGILSRRAVYPHFGVRTTLVFHAFRAGVVFGIERVCGTGFAFCVFCTVLGDEFLALSALCDCHERNLRRNQRSGKGICSCVLE